MTKQSILEKVGELEQFMETAKLSASELSQVTEKLEGLTFKLQQLGLKLKTSAFLEVLALKYPQIDFKEIVKHQKLVELLKTHYDWNAGMLGFDDQSQPLLAQLIEQGLVTKSWIYFDQNGYEEVLDSPPEAYQEDGIWFSPETGDEISKEEFDLEVQPRWFASFKIRELAEEIYYGPRPVPQEPPAFEE